MGTKVEIPEEVKGMFETIVSKFESKLNVNDYNADYFKGDIGFGYKNNNHDFEIVFNIFRKNFVIVIDFWKTGQKSIDVQYEEENKEWYIYSYSVNWEEQLEQIKPLETSFLDEIINGFSCSVYKQEKSNEKFLRVFNSSEQEIKEFFKLHYKPVNELKVYGPETNARKYAAIWDICFAHFTEYAVLKVVDNQVEIIENEGTELEEKIILEHDEK